MAGHRDFRLLALSPGETGGRATQHPILALTLGEDLAGMWVGLEGPQDEPGVLTPLEERTVEVSRGTSTPAGKETGSPEGQGPCHVHLCSVYWNLALWGRGSVGWGEAMPERPGAHLSPSPGQDVLSVHSFVALLPRVPRLDHPCVFLPLTTA